MIKQFLSLALVVSPPFAASAGDYEVEEQEHSLTAFLNGKELWTYNHDPAEGKPYFHPMATSSGINLTGLRPEDHPWHRGLWFSWKFINKVNYWEESRETGLSEGRTSILHFQGRISTDKTTHLQLKLSYTPAASTTPVLIEVRKVTISAPDKDGIYTIDWESEFFAGAKQVVFDRTPLEHEAGGKKWGGYAGLSLRMNQDVNGGLFHNSEGQQGEAVAHRQPAQWMSYTPPNGGFVVLLDHPDNLNYPNKWYISEKMGFFSPSVVHDVPHTLQPHSSLKLKHRVIVSGGALNPPEIEALYTDWLN